MSARSATSASRSLARSLEQTAPAIACGTRQTLKAAPPANTWSTTAVKAVWLVDPGINGVHNTRPDGTEVRKFDAPKATLVSYIIKGILDRELPWDLILFGAMLALLMEISGVPSLAFAVGVYLPISSTTPIFIGGLIRYFVDRRKRKEPEMSKLDEAQFAAQADRGPGVLFASGYIAGGAIAGIVIAFLAGVLGDFDASLQRWATASNPFYEGPHADLAVAAALPGAGGVAVAGGARPVAAPLALRQTTGRRTSVRRPCCDARPR